MLTEIDIKAAIEWSENHTIQSSRQSVKEAILMTCEGKNKQMTAFVEWMSDRGYKKRNYTHPNKVGKWFSDIEDTGYLTTEEMLYKFLITIK